MASSVIRKTWFSWPATGVVAKVPLSGAGNPISEAAWIAQLSPWLQPGTRTTTPAGAVLAGNVASSTPAGGANANAGSSVAYVVAV